MMWRHRHSFTATALAFAGAAFLSTGRAVTAPPAMTSTSAPSNQACLGCHGAPGLARTEATGELVPLSVDRHALKSSAHAALPCVDCHRAATALPHRGRLGKVDCGRCHYVEPLPRPSPQGTPASGPGVHQRAVEAGVREAPICQTCHGDHDVRPADDPASRVHRSRVQETCGRCHLREYSEYQGSVHGVALAAGNPDVPMCTDCHGSHRVVEAAAADSRVGPGTAPKTCGRCHDSESLTRRYQIPPDRLATYRESFHGLANQFGSTRVANCASCHNAHDIRPSSDPRSSINPANLPKTCGTCHQDASENFARGKVHVRPVRSESMSLWLVSSGFKWLTTTVMIMLVGHIMLDLNTRRREWRKVRGGGRHRDDPAI